jgi:hypothetical protein
MVQNNVVYREERERRKEGVEMRIWRLKKENLGGKMKGDVKDKYGRSRKEGYSE